MGVDNCSKHKSPCTAGTTVDYRKEHSIRGYFEVTWKLLVLN